MVTMAIDALTVGAVDGVVEKKMKIWKVFFIAFIFGLLQFAMPVVGYFIGYAFKDFLLVAIPWIAFGLLGLLSIKSLFEWTKETFFSKENEDKKINKVSIPSILFQGIATSIDALCIGLVFLNLDVANAMLVFSLIGVTTFVLTLISTFLGKFIASYIEKIGGLIAGIVFLAVGLKILIEGMIEIDNILAIIITSSVVVLALISYVIMLILLTKKKNRKQASSEAIK